MPHAIVKLLCNEPPTLQNLEFAPSETVRALLSRLEAAEPAANLALLHAGIELDPGLTLRGVPDGAVLHVIATRRSVRLETSAPAEATATAATSLASRFVASGVGGLPPHSPSGQVTPHVPSLEDVVPAATLASRLASPAPPPPPPPEAEGDLSEEDDVFYHPAPPAPAAASPLRDSPPAEPLPPLDTAVDGSSADGGLADDSPPPDRLQLQWATGFCARAGVAVLGTGEVVYAAGRILVVHHCGADVQRHFCGHARSTSGGRGGGGGGAATNLYRFPCPKPEKPGAPNRHAAGGHSSPALACVWAEGASSSHETLLTAGGQDLCVLQWSLERRSHNRMMFGAATGV